MHMLPMRHAVDSSFFIIITISFKTQNTIKIIKMVIITSHMFRLPLAAKARNRRLYNFQRDFSHCHLIP